MSDAEYYTYPILWLVYAIGLAELRRRTQSMVQEWATLAITCLAAARHRGGTVHRPQSRDRRSRCRRPLSQPDGTRLSPPRPPFRGSCDQGEAAGAPSRSAAAAEIAAIVLTFAYLTLEVTRFHRGPLFSAVGMSDAELYTYSAVWLAFGVALLLAGIALTSQTLRLASAAMVAITVGKVFIIDLAGLTGGLRALSFIGLGLVLVGIGWLYQRLLFPRRQAERAPPS